MSYKMRNRERGVALILTLLALMILSAIAATLVTMSATETTVNTNYRSEEVAFFAARAGLYEVTDRMMQLNASTIDCSIPTGLPGAAQTAAPTCALPPPSVLYLINSNTATGTVAPWSATNAYADDELCHEGYTIAGMSSTTPDTPCTGTTMLPSGTTWYGTVSSNAPWNNTAAAMPYVWVRLAMKVNDSSSYIAGPNNPACAYQTPCYNSVDATQAGGTAGTAVCWNGVSEVLLNPPVGSTLPYNCGQMQGGTPPTADTPVYVVTALAVTSQGARQMVQTEVALPPATVIASPAGFSDPDGFFANSNVCSSGGSAPFNLSGGITIDGYNSASGGTYSSTHSASLGSIGSNGSVVMSGHASVGGNIHVQHVAVNGTCPTSDVYSSGGATEGGIVAISPYTPSVPCTPNPPGCPVGTTEESLSGHANVTLVPGNYDQISVSGGSSLTLTGPGTYNINCMSLSGNSTLAISPATTQVVVNITGNTSLSGTKCSGSSPLDLSGGVVTNTSQVAANLMFNYGGTASINLSGGTTTYFVTNAPNAVVNLSGGSGIYGAIIANTINDSGGVSLHFDSTLISAPSNGTTSTTSSTSNYGTISLRSLQY